jgi:hypothetical protein
MSGGLPISAIVAGIAFLGIGFVLLIWPRVFLDPYHSLLSRMRGLPLVEWEMGHLKTRTAGIFTRLFGAFVILGGLSIFFYASAGR